MRTPVRVEPGFEKEARGSNDSRWLKPGRGRSFGNVCNVAQIIRFFPERATHLPQSFKITKGKSICPSEPCAGPKDRGIRTIRQRKMAARVKKLRGAIPTTVMMNSVSASHFFA